MAFIPRRAWMSIAGIEKSHRAILFPGQGSQFVGMGQDLYHLYPRSAKLVFDEADEALGNGLRSLIFEGEQEKLKRTENAQPAILTTSIAMLRVLEVEFGFDISKACNYALGHSLGEYTALVATGALSLTDAVRLVRLRGERMTQAVADRQGQTAMSALVVRKAKLSDLEQAIKEINDGLPGNELSFQVVISGTSKGVDEASRTLQSQRLAARAVDLPVSAPFHCSLMKEAADAMEEAFKSVTFKKPCVDVISNVTAKPYTNVEEIPKLLVEQVTSTVEWQRSISYCKGQDIEQFISFGPGKVLANLIKKEYPLDRIIDILFLAIKNIKSIDMSTAFTQQIEEKIIEAAAIATDSVVLDQRYVHPDPRNYKGRLGYACLNTILRHQKPPVFCSRTCRLDTIRQKGIEFVKELALQNVQDLITLIEWNEAHGIKFMRISSDMFPFASHDTVGYSLDYAKDELKKVGKLSAKYGHRLRNLLPGDKPATIARFEETYRKLPEPITRRLVIENDELCYSVSDILPVCQRLNVPLVLDCINPGEIGNLLDLVPAINQTWTGRGLKPKQHYSESRPGAVSAVERRAHSDRYTIVLPPSGDDVDLMIEAKDKEQAVFQLYKLYDLYPVDDDVWVPTATAKVVKKKVKKRKVEKGADGETVEVKIEEEVVDDVETAEQQRIEDESEGDEDLGPGIRTRGQRLKAKKVRRELKIQEEQEKELQENKAKKSKSKSKSKKKEKEKGTKDEEENGKKKKKRRVKDEE
ncbi:hypothetical protein BDB00DRAFT_884673 [Zychaea mexicana]|uniref:uncharacterized protein n=1 Tax=Zychaea mexicana TaxID=64656 RepID=UPI0022FEF93C|nr:uncharacterized protein BDB00DRAFT_884673 [Zychaea mexicana]KAI9488971.1 hypothetical protein BDB00DRAFT_884673 [Zychaea mexicana]